jgi:hypothetical protein
LSVVVHYRVVKQASRRRWWWNGGVVWWQGTQAKLLRCQKQRTFHGERNRIKTKGTEKKKRKLKRRGRELDDGGEKR